MCLLVSDFFSGYFSFFLVWLVGGFYSSLDKRDVVGRRGRPEWQGRGEGSIRFLTQVDVQMFRCVRFCDCVFSTDLKL